MIGKFQRGSQRTDQEPTKESHLRHLTSFISFPSSLCCECSCWSWESHRQFNSVLGCLRVATIGSFGGFGCEDGEELKTDCDNVRLWTRFSSFVMEIFGDYLNWSAADPAMIAFVRRSFALFAVNLAKLEISSNHEPDRLLMEITPKYLLSFAISRNGFGEPAVK